MNRKAFGLLTIVWFIGGLVVSAFVADFALKNVLGLGLVDIYNFLIGIEDTVEDAPSLDDVMSQLSPGVYEELSLQRGNISEVFSGLGASVDQINSNPELTKVFNAAFGSNYKVYMFTVTTIGNLTFKVFEWSIQLTGGNVTVFQAGKTFSEYNVFIQLDNAVAYELFKGSADPEQAINWIKDKKIKIKPITFIFGFVNALPQLIELMQEHVEIK
jgi:hypothetical protein